MSGIWNEFDIGEIGEKFEERIAGLGDENFVSGIAEQAEDVGVGFAGAGGQKQAIGVEIENAVGVAIVAADGLASAEETARLRVVARGVGVGEG